MPSLLNRVVVRPPRLLLLVIGVLALGAPSDGPSARTGCQPKDAITLVVPGTVFGTIDTSDCLVLPHRNAYGEFWSGWYPRQGDRLVFTARRGSMVDPYLILLGPAGNVVAADDDSYGMQDARIDFTKTTPGTEGPYTLVVTSFLQTPATDFGTYQLSYHFGPTSARNLRSTVTGNQVALAWDRANGRFASNFILQAGNANGTYNIFTGPIGSGTSLVASNLPSGPYYWRLIAQHPEYDQPPSDEAFFQIGSSSPCTPPGAPEDFTFSVIGLQVTLKWRASPSGGTPATYVVEAGSQPALANLYNAPTGSAETVLAVSAPPGLYYVRIRAGNDCGTSPPSITHAIAV